jgi:hypothetical protein
VGEDRRTDSETGETNINPPALHPNERGERKERGAKENMGKKKGKKEEPLSTANVTIAESKVTWPETATADRKIAQH